MLRYEPDETFAHRLDPRSKLLFQFGFAIAALAHTSVLALAVLSGIVVMAFRISGVSFRWAFQGLKFPIIVIAAAPVIAALSLGPPWIDIYTGYDTARSGYRVVLILLISAIYVRTTPVSASRAAIHQTIPGKPGRLVGMGVSLVFRFLPVLQSDLRAIDTAVKARGGESRSALDRVRIIGTQALTRSFTRADRLALALEARCFSWNPTFEELSFNRIDVPVCLIAVGFLVIGVSAAL